ncbi:MAG TPA: NUDIX hydrolase [Streptosporangiaceae bacterium]|nr:NUDIX hydrolase [Streptosporangiaceae bacterium]
MADRPAADEIRAAGAVAWRPGPDGPLVALVHRPKYDDWTLPKGKMDPGESVLLTAVREVEEETGQRVTLGRRLSASCYDVDGRPKRVDYWVARAQDPPAEFVPSHEVDQLAWLSVPEAADRMTYERDVVVLGEFAAGPADTEPLILLRHASAGSRASWRGADLARPLDARGAADADALAWMLRCFGADRLVTSAAERCVATVRPFAALTGAKIEIEPLFTVGAMAAPDAVALRAAGLAADQRPAVVCVHRENLPMLLAAACARLGSSPPSGGPLAKGGFWVLHVADAELAATERHAPNLPD